MSLVCARCGQENPDGFRFCGSCGAPVETAPGRDVRKTVTVLFADVVGSTARGEARDPETVRKEMARWFEQARTILERHGGTVEKFVGDAVMAVFGIPRAHEDDALRAVRAAAELRDPMIRIGVNTGQVVAGEGETLVTGDAVNVTARLEQAAEPGEILIGAETHRLVRDAVDVEPSGPLTLKGKANAVEAYRLVGIDPEAEGIARRLDSPLVGRDRELERLRQDFARSIEDRVPYLFTLLGTAGVGKSRLVAEFLPQVDARTLRGRCLHYGEGITYFPLVEVLLQLGEDADAILTLPSPAEIQLSARRRLEQASEREPLVIVFDDIQWAEPTFLDLIEHVSDFARGVPLFLLCVARPELLDQRPTWGGGKLNATTILLEPLDAAATLELIENLKQDGVDAELQDRIVSASQGNPLFVEEMLAMVDEGGADVAIPPTIHALLQARLDTLASDERAVIERGAVEGEVFHRAPVATLTPDLVRQSVDTQLSRLVRKELIRPAKATFPGDDAFRFRHLLIRDAAYESLPKETRADLHERFALWLEEHVDLVEQDEIVGYHLEQAARYRDELGRPDTGLANRAATRLGAAGKSALARSDYPAGAKMIERALALAPQPAAERADLLVELSSAYEKLGRIDEAERFAAEAAASTDATASSRGRLVLVQQRAWSGRATADDIFRVAEEVRPVFEEANDILGLAEAIWAEAAAHWGLCHAQETAALGREAAAYAEQAGATALVQDIYHFLLPAYVFGPQHVAEVEKILEEARSRSSELILARATADRALARCAAARGEFERAWSLAHEGREPLAATGLRVAHAAMVQVDAFIALSQRNPVAAEQVLRDGVEQLAELGERAYHATLAAALADCLCDQGREDEAERWLATSRELTPPSDMVNFIYTEGTEARVLARRGEFETAERVARGARKRAEQTDFWELRMRTNMQLAEVLARDGRVAEAREAYGQAIATTELKGATAWTDQIRSLVTEL